ncbi:MAG: NAD-dependent epimerase/dehydratase family protein [Bacteroidetes bacterium]|nr:NAD-dependent epimerase/dehydratase family protein [Bacteroidota bacterium]
MKTILVTGSDGFMGRNLIEALNRIPETTVLKFDIPEKEEVLFSHLEKADAVFHLAGINRPQNEDEFTKGNADLTKRIVQSLLQRDKKPLLALSSSIQAALDNPYGRSKLEAEQAVEDYGAAGGNAVIFRLPNVFGKWSRPNYNSAVATFCHNIARGLDITVSDPKRVVELVYIDDVVKGFTSLLKGLEHSGVRRPEIKPVKSITLRDLVDEILRMRDIRTGLLLPDMNDSFRKALYATYLSFLPSAKFDYKLVKHEDPRGSLAELLKSPHFGQIFISRTKPGITRGNHWHDTKVEKFCVVEGHGIIRFRHVTSDEVLSYDIKGEEFRVVDIPPGYTHSIENVGGGEMVVLFWSSEPFNPEVPDTYFLPVLKNEIKEGKN